MRDFAELPRGFRARVRQHPTSCWIWIGPIRCGGHDRVGYGVYGKRGAAHRFAYQHLVGPIPPGLVLDHLCEEPLCVRPEHLEPVTLEENVRRGNESKRLRMTGADESAGPWPMIQMELW